MQLNIFCSLPSISFVLNLERTYVTLFREIETVFGGVRLVFLKNTSRISKDGSSGIIIISLDIS